MENRISLNYVADFIKAFPDEWPVVSVGSGPGTAEWKLIHECGLNDRRFILVDPSPESFKSYPRDGKCREPDFPLVKDLIQAEPGIVGTCLLLLPWSYPNHSTYDIEAVHLLAPKGIVIAYEKLGGAGGFAMHLWLSKMNESEETSQPEGSYVLDPLNIPLYNASHKKRVTQYRVGPLHDRLLALYGPGLTPTQAFMDLPTDLEIDKPLEYMSDSGDTRVLFADPVQTARYLVEYLNRRRQLNESDE